MPSIFAPYLPAFQLRRLAARMSLPQTASEERAHGATLLLDIAGFTSLTDQFASRGPAGAEQLSDILNNYFGRMTDIIARHGGDVVLFAGDAVLAVWPTPATDVTGAVRLAAQCALTLTDQLHDIAIGDVALRHRGAIGAGPISYLEVGGEGGHWHPLLAGDAIAQLGPTRKLARPGEIMLSPEAAQAIAQHARVEFLDDGEARLESVNDPLPLAHSTDASDANKDDLLRAYVPDVVLQRLEAGHGEWLAEFRSVVVVFIHIAGIEYGTTGTLDRLQRAMLAVQRPLQHYEGTVYQFLMDDKGTSLVAAFGLPHLSQEHEAARAVSAATAIHAELSNMAVRASIGIAAGRAFCGAYGTRLRRQYTIVGPVINLASRLTQPAAGGILCDESTFRRAQERVRFETLPPVSIKGRSEPVPVFRPLGRVADVTDAPAMVFVGREAERRVLRERIEAAQQGDGGVIGLSGEAGLGKSYLLRDVVQQARTCGMQVITAAADAMERSTTYFVWRALLTRLLAPGPEPSVAELRAVLLQQLSDDETLLSWAPLLNVILPLGLEDNDVTRYMESEARIDSIQAMLAHLLERASSAQPTILIVDDVHWLDSTSAAVLLGVATRVRELLIVLATRPLDETAATGVQRLLDWPNGLVIELQPLSTDDVDALICQRLGARAVAPEVSRFIDERAEGHPFYAEELALALREAGLVAVRDGVCCATTEELRSANFPDSVQAVVISRIDRLSPIEQLAAKTASVIGRTFPYEVLEAVYPVEQDRPLLRSALREIERADLARMDSPDPHLSYLFRHIITQDVAYNSLLFSQRRQLHERIASWYEQHYDGALSALYPLLAHHWDHAEVAARAVDYLEKAGVEALSAFSSRECAQFFQRVLEIADQHPELGDVHRRAEWQRYLGDAYQHMTDYDRSRVHFEEALRLLGRATAHGRVARVWQFGKEAARQVLHRALPRYIVGSAHGGKQRDLTNAAVTYRGLMEIAFFQGDNLGMAYAALCALNCGERARVYTPMATGAGALAVMFSVLGMRRLRTFYIDLAARYAREGLNLTDIAYVEGIQTTLVEIAAGRWKEAEAAAQRGMSGLARVGYRLRWESQYAGYAFMLQLTGRFKEAMHAFNEIYVSARGTRLQNVIFARSGQIGTALACGDVKDEWLDELGELIARSAPMTEATTSYGLIAQARLRRGDVAGAWTALERGLDLVSKHPPDTYYGLTGFANIAATYLEMWERRLALVPDDEVGRRARQACRLLRNYSRFMRMGRPRAARCDAWYHALRGRRAKAIRLLDQGVASARKQQLPYDEALLHYELARWLPESDARREEHLQLAASQFERLGAGYDLERARALQDTSFLQRATISA